jgi:hypothetical protein
MLALIVGGLTTKTVPLFLRFGGQEVNSHRIMGVFGFDTDWCAGLGVADWEFHRGFHLN